jgi:hypothetical protein
MPDDVNYCGTCGSYQGWVRRQFKGSQPVLLLLTALFSVLGALFTAGNYFLERHSHTSVTVTDADEKAIYVFLSNTGRRPAILRSCRLRFDELPIVSADLFPTDNNIQNRVITPGAVKLALTLPGLTADCPRKDIEQLINTGHQVTLQMEVTESDDPSAGFCFVFPPRQFHLRSDTFPASRIGAFLMEKTVER